MFFPCKYAIPYSVTTYLMSPRFNVTPAPSERKGTILDYEEKISLIYQLDSDNDNIGDACDPDTPLFMRGDVISK